MSLPTDGHEGNAYRRPWSNEIPTRWWARVDGCPMCVHNVEAPHRVEETENSTRQDPGFYAWYRCHDCGHEWRTAWADIEWEGLFA